MRIAPSPLHGTVAVTDAGWYRHLLSHFELEEVNFWKPSAVTAFKAPEFSPYFFKLKSPYNAICGFGYFARYTSLPIWLAWDTFGQANGCSSLDDLRVKIAELRAGIDFEGPPDSPIGCVLILQPVFFPKADWVPQPKDWPRHTVTGKGYDLTTGEGARIWNECLNRSRQTGRHVHGTALDSVVAEQGGARYGLPYLTQPRLGQGTFRIAVMDAYTRRCSVTGEHSLPALEAAHIRSFEAEGPHEVRNGLLLRADFHRLFDQGYATVSDNLHLEVSSRLRTEFENGHSYYPFHGKVLSLPADQQLRPSPDFLAWHRENVYVA